MLRLFGMAFDNNPIFVQLFIFFHIENSILFLNYVCFMSMNMSLSILGNFNFISFLNHIALLIGNGFHFHSCIFPINLLLCDFDFPVVRLFNRSCAIVFFNLHNISRFGHYDLSIFLLIFLSINLFPYDFPVFIYFFIMMYDNLLIALNFYLC